MFTVLQTEPIEGEVSEIRVHFGPGYRLYFVRRGRVIIVMLSAGDKSTQKRDIRHALKLASELGDDL
jgi:putative addiction module killer protein